MIDYPSHVLVDLRQAITFFESEMKRHGLPDIDIVQVLEFIHSSVCYYKDNTEDLHAMASEMVFGTWFIDYVLSDEQCAELFQMLLDLGIAMRNRYLEVGLMGPPPFENTFTYLIYHVWPWGDVIYKLDPAGMHVEQMLYQQKVLGV